MNRGIDITSFTTGTRYIKSIERSSSSLKTGHHVFDIYLPLFLKNGAGNAKFSLIDDVLFVGPFLFGQPIESSFLSCSTHDTKQNEKKGERQTHERMTQRMREKAEKGSSTDR